MDDEETQPLRMTGDRRPVRLVRTALCSMADSDAFGEQMAGEAKVRRFSEAPAKAFLGDGLVWNWTIWKRRFPEFTPILDFIHALSWLSSLPVPCRSAGAPVCRSAGHENEFQLLAPAAL